MKPAPHAEHSKADILRTVFARCSARTAFLMHEGLAPDFTVQKTLKDDLRQKGKTVLNSFLTSVAEAFTTTPVGNKPVGRFRPKR